MRCFLAKHTKLTINNHIVTGITKPRVVMYAENVYACDLNMLGWYISRDVLRAMTIIDHVITYNFCVI